MTDFLDVHIKNFDFKNLPKRINQYLKAIKSTTQVLTTKSKIQIEIEKTKLELNKKYKQLGEFVSIVYLNEKVRDFSYKEEYFLLNKEIYLIKQYLNKLVADKNSLK